MAVQVIKTTKTKRRVKKGSPDYIQCNICGGLGYIPNWHRRKKK